MAATTFTNGTTITSTFLNDIQNAEHITYTNPQTGASGRSIEAKLSEFISVKDFGALGNDSADDTAAILAACTAANTLGVLKVYIPAGTYRHTTLDLTDKSVRLVGDGVNATILKYVGANTADGIKFGTSQSAAKYVRNAGLEDLMVNCNSLARYGVYAISILGCVFRNIHIEDPYTWGMYWETLDDEIPSAVDTNNNQYNDVSNVFVRCDGVTSAGGMYFKGNLGAAASAGANTSLNHFQNIRLNIRNGDGFYIANGDGNTIMSLYVFRPNVNTGRGLVFGADNDGDNKYARNNFGFNIQCADASVYALAGDGTQPSEENFVVFSNGNGGVDNPPTIEAGASLGWMSDRMLNKMGMHQGVFTYSASLVTAQSNINTQLAALGTESIRIHSGNNNHAKFTNNTETWGMNIDGNTGNFRVTRDSGSGTFQVSSIAVKTETQTASSKTLDNQTGVLLVDATGGNRTVTLPAANAFGTSRTSVIQIRRIDASGNTVTVQRGGSDNLNGGTSETLAAGVGKTYISDASANWYSF